MSQTKSSGSKVLIFDFEDLFDSYFVSNFEIRIWDLDVRGARNFFLRVRVLNFYNVNIWQGLLWTKQR